jgi:hypothetical protein
MKCIACGSERTFNQIIGVNKRGRLPLKSFLFLLSKSADTAILICIPIIGWLIIIIMYIRGYKIDKESWSICQDCGFRMKID